MQMIMAQGLADQKIVDVVSDTRNPMTIELRGGRARNGLISAMRGAIGSGLIALGSKVRGTRIEQSPPVACQQ